jgi:tRNA threonylcarbamoyladenosine biosynthesis protein TsaE
MNAVELRTPLATRRLGRKLGALLEVGDFVALVGDLGAGKTLLVRGVAEGAAVPEEERTTSPTFALVNLYRGGRVLLQHVDLYRLGGADELYALGFDDLLREPAATLVEWADRAEGALPADRLEIALIVRGPTWRRAELRGTGPRSEALRAALVTPRPRR